MTNQWKKEQASCSCTADVCLRQSVNQLYNKSTTKKWSNLFFFTLLEYYIQSLCCKEGRKRSQTGCKSDKRCIGPFSCANNESIALSFPKYLSLSFSVHQGTHNGPILGILGLVAPVLNVRIKLSCKDRAKDWS